MVHKHQSHMCLYTQCNECQIVQDKAGPPPPPGKSPS